MPPFWQPLRVFRPIDSFRGANTFQDREIDPKVRVCFGKGGMTREEGLAGRHDFPQSIGKVLT